MKRKIPRNVFFLGVVSFLTDLSSEMIIPVILPIFMRAKGISLPAIGAIEGVAESAASLLKLASGWLSDRLKRRKSLVAVGYVVSTLAKPLFAFSGVWWHFLTIRFAERAGKGIRTAPRDALVAASTRPETWGLSFGFHRAMDTAGAFFGLLSAVALVWVFKLEPEQYRPLFLIAFVPAALAVGVIVFCVREHVPSQAHEKAAVHERQEKLGRRFTWYLLVVGVFTLGNSSDAFLALRASSIGYSIPAVILLMLLMNAVDAALATHLGGLSDRIGRKHMLAVGFVVYSFVYLGLAFVENKWLLIPLFAAYGLYYAISRAAFRAMVADLAPSTARGMAYGLFHMVVGIAALPASVMVGFLWKKMGAAYAFSFGAALAFLAAILLLMMPRNSGKSISRTSTER